MQASPWFLEVVGRVPRWSRAVWLGALLALSVAVGWALATCASGECVDRRAATGRTLTQLQQGMQMAWLSVGSDAGCPEALAAATVSGLLEHGADAWGQPVEVRCYGDTLVLRSHGHERDDPYDDIVLVSLLAPRGSRAVSLTEEPR